MIKMERILLSLGMLDCGIQEIGGKNKNRIRNLKEIGPLFNKYRASERLNTQMEGLRR